jgi:DNA-binding CsgD family transcriptional regulator
MITTTVADRITHFLNRLPITGDRDQWTKTVLGALHELCPDVDRFSININLLCDPLSKEKPEEGLSTSVKFTKVGANKTVTISPPVAPEESSAQFEREFGNFVKLSDYHPPKFFHYFLDNGESLATITLLREEAKPPVSEESLRLLSELEAFMKFAFASFLSMQKVEEPFTAVFRNAVARMQREAKFSEQEFNVLILKLTGYSYKMIAAHMNISLNTVRTHTKAIHRKTGTRSHTELFAKYFTPVAREFLP